MILHNRKINIYGKRMNRPDKFAFDGLRTRLDVSSSALTIRLRQLGYINYYNSRDYYDPTDIVCDDDFDSDYPRRGA